MENPFKFGSIVENEFFTDRVKEVAYIRQFIESRNHLVLISPRYSGSALFRLSARISSQAQSRSASNLLKTRGFYWKMY